MDEFDSSFAEDEDTACLHLCRPRYEDIVGRYGSRPTGLDLILSYQSPLLGRSFQPSKSTATGDHSDSGQDSLNVILNSGEGIKQPGKCSRRYWDESLGFCDVPRQVRDICLAPIVGHLKSGATNAEYEVRRIVVTIRCQLVDVLVLL